MIPTHRTHDTQPGDERGSLNTMWVSRHSVKRDKKGLESMKKRQVSGTLFHISEQMRVQCVPTNKKPLRTIALRYEQDLLAEIG